MAPFKLYTLLYGCDLHGKRRGRNGSREAELGVRLPSRSLRDSSPGGRADGAVRGARCGTPGSACPTGTVRGAAQSGSAVPTALPIGGSNGVRFSSSLQHGLSAITPLSRLRRQLPPKGGAIGGGVPYGCGARCGAIGVGCADSSPNRGEQWGAILFILAAWFECNYPPQSAAPTAPPEGWSHWRRRALRGCGSPHRALRGAPSRRYLTLRCSRMLRDQHLWHIAI